MTAPGLSCISLLNLFLAYLLPSKLTPLTQTVLHAPNEVSVNSELLRIILLFLHFHVFTVKYRTLKVPANYSK